MIRHSARVLAFLVLTTACKETSGPAIPVTLSLHSVDGVVIPAPLTTSTGQKATIQAGFLQGTNWGHACGVSLGLAEGPLTTVSIPGCRLKRDEERTFSITLNDVRFPSGAHQYRFVPQ